MDGEYCRSQARRVSALAEQVGGVPARLGSAAVAGVDWQSGAARAFRDLVAAEAVRLRLVAAAAQEAADALALHARALDEWGVLL